MLRFPRTSVIGAALLVLLLGVSARLAFRVHADQQHTVRSVSAQNAPGPYSLTSAVDCAAPPTPAALHGLRAVAVFTPAHRVLLYAEGTRTSPTVRPPPSRSA